MQRSKAAASKERVLDAAAKLFHDCGYAATTMRDVAERAEMKAASLYYHYKSKEALLEAVLEKSITDLSRAVSPYLECGAGDVSYRERIARSIRAHLETTMALGDYAAASRRLLAEMPQAMRARHEQARHALGDKWRRLLEAARAAGEIRPDVNLSLARLFLIGALNFTHEWYDPAISPVDQVAKSFAEMLFSGLSPRAMESLGAPEAARPNGARKGHLA